MIDFDKWQEIYASLSSHKLRTFLTAFGVFWGILMLMLLLGIGKGLENGNKRWFGSDDPKSIWIFARHTALPYQGMSANRKVNFTEADLKSLKQDIPGIEFISAENRAGKRWQRSVNIVHEKKSVSFPVYGVDSQFFNIKKFIELHYGRTINKNDDNDRRKVTMIGTKVSESLFGAKANPIRKRIVINGISLKIIGVFFDSGHQGRLSERVYIPLSTFQSVFGADNKIDTITLTPKPDINAFQLESKIVDYLKRKHLISPKDTKAISVNNVAKTSQDLDNFNSAVKIFIWFVGLGTLISGVVGISNIMIITVKDRTREIGVRKALGATPFSIVNMIITESVLVTTIAGYLGLILGVGILEAIDLLISTQGGDIAGIKNPEINLDMAFTALAILVIAGTLAGLAPALRAASILPIEAMRDK